MLSQVACILEDLRHDAAEFKSCSPFTSVAIAARKPGFLTHRGHRGFESGKVFCKHNLCRFERESSADRMYRKLDLQALMAARRVALAYVLAESVGSIV